MNRFDFIAFDTASILNHTAVKQKVEEIETLVEKSLANSRSKQIAYTKLEEFYMWVGKAIRDDQLARTASEKEGC